MNEKAQLIIDYSRQDLITFAQAIDQTYNPNWHHEEIANALMKVESGEIKRLMIFVPPRNGKSRLATEIFPTWYLGRNPNKEVITASNTEDLAKDFGRKAREIVAEPLYNSIFNIGLKQDEKSASKWRTSSGGSYTSVGIGGTITGRGAHLLIIDDPIKNAEDAQSVLFRNKQWDWYRSVAYTRLMKNASVIIILTRWHTDDIAGRLLEQAEEGGDKWHIIKFPAIAEEDEKFRKKGEALWQSEFPLKKILEIKRVVGPYVFSCTPKETPILMADWTFKRIEDVRPGDMIMGFELGSQKNRSHLKKTIVKRTFTKMDTVYDMEMESGRTIRCTKDHRWFTGRKEGRDAKGNYKGRKQYAPAKIGSKLRFSIEPVFKEDLKNPLDWAYLSAMIDGEGHIGKNTLTLCQSAEGNNLKVSERIIATLKKLGIDYNESYLKREKYTWRDIYNWQIRNPRDIYTKLLAFGMCAKENQIQKRLYERVGKLTREQDKVIDIKNPKEEQVYALETGTGNYIAWGYLSSNSLYQQEPITNESQLFSDSWFKYRDACDVDALSTRNFLTIDTAVSQTNTADYTGFCDNRVDAQNFWNLSAWRERINPKDLLDKLFFLHQNNRYEKIGIEKTMYTQVIQPFLDEEMRKRNQFLPIVELQHGGVRKEERIKWLIARYSSGSIYHIRGKTQDLEEELVTFPKSKFDDVSDAVAYQTQIAQSSFENTWEEEEELNFNTDW